MKDWWKGRRGEWYVVIQIALFVLVVWGPRGSGTFEIRASGFNTTAIVLGCMLMLTGGIFSAAGLLRLGKNLTPLPYPKSGSQLIQTGIFSIVRHPIYSGAILAAFGWALYVNSWLTLVYAFLLFIFFDIKSRREEQWLTEKFPDYPQYCRRVKKLIPFIY